MKLKTLEKAVDSLPKNLAKLSWIQKNDYFQLQDRIYCLDFRINSSL
jgi:hypothetical protein